MATGAAPGAGREPGRPVEEWPLSAAAVADMSSAARCALAAEADASPQPGPDWSAVDPRAFVHAVRAHRIAPLLTAQADAVGAPTGIRRDLRALAVSDAVRSLDLAREATRAVSAVRAAGVRVALMKGVALSAQTTGTLTARTGGDIDLLVDPADLPAVHDALLRSGWTGEPLGEPGRAWSRYLRMRRERTYASSTSCVDLHWRIGWHDHPMPATSDLLARAVPVSLIGVEVPTLCPSDALAAACYHAAVDRYARLRGLADIVRLVRRPDVAPVVGASWRLRRLVAESVAFCDELLGAMPANRMAPFLPAAGVGIGHVRGQWAHSSVRRIWFDDDVALPELVGIYRDSARFAGGRAALAMAVTDALLPPERVAPGDGPVELAGKVAREAVDLIRRRLR